MKKILTFAFASFILFGCATRYDIRSMPDPRDAVVFIYPANALDDLKNVPPEGKYSVSKSAQNEGSSPIAQNLNLAGGVIVVNQEPMTFPAGINGPVTWTLRGPPSFQFAIDGILFFRESGSGNTKTYTPETNEFSPCTRSNDRRKYTCTNNHTGPGTFKYQIKLEGGPTPSVMLDPYIYNG